MYLQTRLCLLGFVLLLTACVHELHYPKGARILCDSSSDCPDDFACQLETGLCVSNDGADGFSCAEECLTAGGSDALCSMEDVLVAVDCAACRAAVAQQSQLEAADVATELETRCQS